MGHFERCITLWMYALDMQQKMLEPLSPMTQSSLLSFAELFSFMMSEGRNRNNNSNNNNNNFSNRNNRDNNNAVANNNDNQSSAPINFCDIMTVFEKAVQEVKTGQEVMKRLNSNNSSAAASECSGTSRHPHHGHSGERDITYFNRTLIIILHLICLLTRLMPHLRKEQIHGVKSTIYHFLKLDPRGRNSSTPLHLACAKESSSVGRYPICQFPSIDAVRMLLECGADPEARDAEENGPLHVASLNKPAKPAVVKELLKHGAHLDAVNGDNKTFAQTLRGAQVHEIVNPLHYTNLQCLAAKAIKDDGRIRYEQVLPQSLKTFVDLH